MAKRTKYDDDSAKLRKMGLEPDRMTIRERFEALGGVPEGRNLMDVGREAHSEEYGAYEAEIRAQDVLDEQKVHAEKHVLHKEQPSAVSKCISAASKCIQTSLFGDSEYELIGKNEKVPKAQEEQQFLQYDLIQTYMHDVAEA